MMPTSRRHSQTQTSRRSSLRVRNSCIRYVEESSLDSTDLEEELTGIPQQRLSEIEKELQCVVTSQPGAEDPTPNQGYKTRNRRLQQANISGKLNLKTNSSNYSLGSSGRSSVTSCESDDSGICFKSNNLTSPESVQTPDSPATPFTVALHSPSKIQGGVLELVPDISSCNGGSQQYIGYFKPIPYKGSPSHESISHSGHIATNNKPSIAHDTRVPAKKEQETLISRKQETVSSSKQRQGLKRQRSRSTGVTQKVNPMISDNKDSFKKHKSSTPVKHLRSSRRSREARRSESAKDKAKSSILKRIQHHNQSPERPNSLGKLCKTRSQSHTITHTVTVNDNDSKAVTVLSPRQTRTQRTVKRTQRLSQSHNLLLNSADRPSIPSPQSTPEKVVPPALPHRLPSVNLSKCKSAVSDSNTEDSGISSDDQGSTRATTNACKWRFCKSLVSQAELVDHMERVHVASQKRNSKLYRCYWEGCKVYGKVVKSFNWLEGHVKKHLGSRPYYCFFDGCTKNFCSRELLQKHVDNHINEQEQPKCAKRNEVTNKKPEKRNIKRLRGTKICIPKRHDFFSAWIVEAVKWQYKVLNENWSHLLNESGDAITLHGQVVAMSDVKIGKGVMEKRVLLHWFPEEFGLPDSWHSVSDPVTKTRSKSIKISELPSHILYN